MDRSENMTAREWREAFAPVVAAIESQGRTLLRHPGVVAVRPGLRFRKGIETDEPVVTVMVTNKRPGGTLAPGALVPSEIDRVPTDVIIAPPDLLVRHAREAQTTWTESTQEWRVSTALPGSLGPAAAAERGLVAEYQPPPDGDLSAIDEQMTIVCHSSPDSGWRILHDFLAKTNGEGMLTSTMYEFTADHVLNGVIQGVGKHARFRLILDGKRKQLGEDDLSPDQVRHRLQIALKQRFEFVWAATNDGNKTSAAFFPSAYHIKVTVREPQSVWLSSGNWKSSGQPEEDPWNPPTGFDPGAFVRSHNREWHVVADSPSLARVFRRFIEWDIEQAEAVQLPADGEALAIIETFPDLLVPEAAAAPPRFFEELRVTDKLRVQPLLTPDNYLAEILPLVQSAKHRLWFQNQSLSPPHDNPEYEDLFDLLATLSRKDPIDVRIIARGDFDPQAIRTNLKTSRFRMSRVRLQKGCHTKGIIVDDRAVVIGSHNWTGEGTTKNRDASLIFHDRRIIDYYAGLFDYDWNHRAKGQVDDEELIRLAGPGEATPAGMRRVPGQWVLAEMDD